jgi:membrane fusion protein, multidrug efflux system
MYDRRQPQITVPDAMPGDMTEKTGASRGEANPVDALPASERVSGEHEARQSVSRSPGQRPSPRRRLLIGALGVLVLAGVGIFGIPWILASLNTVSTDDAYVNGHVTFVAPRVAGQISRVLVDDNYRVHKGELLAELDKEPFEDAVAVKRAAVDTAAANLRAAEATVRDVEAQARARRWGLQNAVEDVDNKIALLNARVAALDKSKAELTLAQADFYRAQRLLGTPAESRQQFDRAQEPHRLPAHKSPNRWPKSTRFVPLWDCQRNPMAAKVLTKSRRISIRPFLLSSWPRRT